MNRTLADNRMKKFISKNSIWLILIVIVAVVTIIKPVFLTPGNLQTLITTESIKGILAFGIMFAILSKGIDLTPGATVPSSPSSAPLWPRPPMPPARSWASALCLAGLFS